MSEANKRTEQPTIDRAPNRMPDSPLDQTRVSEESYGEQETVPARAPLHTQADLLNDLRRLGVKPGMTLIVHASLRAIGRVVGGPVAVILALEEAVGLEGNVVMPTQTEQLCAPEEYGGDLEAEEIRIIKEHLPVYRPDLTPTSHMGFIAETFRKQSGVLRSAHPHMSFAAWGADAETLTSGHALDDALSETSPLGRIYDKDGRILLLGAPTDSNTSLHLAEYRQRNTFVQPKIWDVKLEIDGEACWTTYRDINNDSDDFGALFDDFRRDTGWVRENKVGSAVSFLIPQRQMVDYAEHWMNRNRRNSDDFNESFR